MGITIDELVAACPFFALCKSSIHCHCSNLRESLFLDLEALFKKCCSDSKSAPAAGKNIDNIRRDFVESGNDVQRTCEEKVFDRKLNQTL